MTATDPAPLLTLPDCAFPAGTTAAWYRGADGRRLRAAYCPARDAIGSVVVSPGRTEHLEKYVEVVEELVGRGYSVLVHDWRGQGLSDRLLDDRLRGHASGFDDFIADFKALIDAFESRLPRPRIALSHSMGACLTLMAAAKGETRFDGMILSAPMLGLRTAGYPRALARTLAWVMNRLGRGGDYVLGGPTDPLGDRFEDTRMTHDQGRFERTGAQIHAHHDLALGNVTWGWLDSAFEAVGWLARSSAVAKIAIPVTLVAAGDDVLVDNAALAKVAARLPHGRYVEIPHAYHEILVESDALRAPFWQAFDALAATISRPA